ncbi:MAG: hypothetical protein E7425_08650 [Ruminococcaceae bacterium]|nr:hypothetical protein [Oscillospiraceae bacterium]
MPYIAIKGFPKDDDTLRKVAERINAAQLELWGCRQEHINISYEAVAPRSGMSALSAARSCRTGTRC